MATQEVGNSRLKEVCTQCGKSYPEGTNFCPADGHELMQTMLDPLIGVVLPRRYRIMKQLGRGSMSVVYEGSYEPLDQLVAIKMLKSHLVSDPHQAKRFQQEIKTAGSLNHPNIVGILDFGVTDQGVPYLIMEHLNGLSLGEVISQAERISVNRAIRIFSQAADALAYAHREGVIHRDIKPSNMILIDEDEDRDIIKVVDFGIAKMQSAGNSTTGAAGLTATGEVVGTPLYMSPEQAQGRDLDGRADIYSLGCVLYHAVTGTPPFLGDTTIDTMRMQIASAALPIDQARPDLFFPERMQHVITKALAKDPRMRYQRMEHFKADLEACDSRRVEAPISVRTKRVDETPPPVVFEEKKSFSPGLLGLCIGLAIIAIIVVASWGITTDVGKKKPKVKVPIPIVTSADSDWRSDMTAAQTAFNDGHFKEAEDSFNQALSQARKFKQPDARVATTLNGLANLYDEEDREDDELKVSNEALAVLKGTKGNDAAMAETLTNLCRIECAQGDLDAAQQHGTKALDIRKIILGAEHHDVAATMQALAQVQCKKGEYAQADALLSDALAICQKSEGEEHLDAASISHDLGMVKEKEKQFSAAEELFNKALGIREKKLGMRHPAVANTLCALGTLNFNLKHDEDAENEFNTAMSIRQQAFGVNSAPTAEVYSCLAILYDSQRKFNQAEDCYRKAVQIREAIYGPASPRLVKSLEHLARFLREHNQANGAEVYEAQIKRIQTQHAMHHLRSNRLV